MKPQTELEKFQVLRIEALERELEKYKSFILELESDFKKLRDEITEQINF